MHEAPAPFFEIQPSVCTLDQIKPSTGLADPTALISRMSVILVSLLAVASFMLSFEALRDLAAMSGAISPGRAWVFPFVVDGAIIVFSISALQASIARRSFRWPMALVVLTTLLSVILNIAHAPKGILSGLIGCTPPLLLFLSFETLMRQIQVAVSPPQEGPPPRVPPKAKPKPAVLPSTSALAQQPEESETTDDRRARARQLLSEGVPKSQVARTLQMSLKTVRKLAASASA